MGPTYSTTSSLGTKPLCVSVTLSNGARILVPINENFTVVQLVAEAARRATAMNLLYDATEATLRSQDGSILFGEDSLKDILDLTETPQLLLGPADVHSYLSTSVSPSVMSTTTYPDGWSQSSKIYIRWISQGRALEHSRLKSLPPDRTPISSDITVHELRALAFERLYPKNPYAEHTAPPDTTVELFLTSCHLCREAGPITLRDLELKGSKTHPLDVFVVPISTREASAGRSDKAWGFSSTDRGTATFQTCLYIFLQELWAGKINLENMTAVIWEVTHFPPAAIALRQLYESGSSNPKPFPCAIFASSFRELSLRMVPSNIAADSESILETSRQVFAWLRSLFSEGYVGLEGSYMTLVHRAELREIRSGQNSSEANQPGRYNHNEYAEFRFWGPDGCSSTESSRKMVLVSKEELDSVKPDVLAAALWGSFESPCNFYFNIPTTVAQAHEHRIVSLLHPRDFDNLLQTTNEIDKFKMIGPLQLGQCASSTLPVITLDSEGYVSRYEQRDRECGNREFFTKNIFREEVLSGSDPGQYLLQKLNPIIQKRKEKTMWELDAWDDVSKTIDTRTPGEAIVICIDHSGSMNTKMEQSWMPVQLGQTRETAASELSRLSEVKEIFKNLVSRISAYRLPTHIGLITFSATVKVDQHLTPILYDFQNRLDGTVASGMTSLFDSLMSAKTMLEEFRSNNPKAKCRIIALTDGLDNHSMCRPETVCSHLYDSDIVLDAIVIGTTATRDLFKMAKHTGGYAFHPQTRDMLFQIFLLDGSIDIKTRPDIQKVAISDYTISDPKTADMQTIYQFPPCRTQPYENDSFISLQDARKYFTTILNRQSRSSSGTTSSEVRSTIGSTRSSGTTLVSGAGGPGRIFLNEVIAMINNPHPSMDVYASESNMGIWKVVMQGPPGSAYEAGTFALFIELGDQFPTKAPSARFKTPVLHPNITKHGRICHEIFGREWHSGIRVYEVIQHIWSIFFSIEARDAVDPLFTLKFWTDPEGGRREVEKYVKHFASKTREQHRIEILSFSEIDAASTHASTVSSWSNLSTRTSSPAPSVLSFASTARASDPQNHTPASGNPQSNSKLSLRRRFGRHH